MSLPEVILWRALRMRPSGFKFRRQHPVGGYVADFACLARRILIEVDGSPHDFGNNPTIDQLRQVDLEAKGFLVIRVTAREVLENVESVVQMIIEACAARAPLHQPAAGPPPRSGEEMA